MKNQHKGIFSTILILVYFLNVLALSEIISTSYAKWYFKYFIIAITILGAFLIYIFTTKKQYYTINLSEYNIISHNYVSNIEYIKSQTGLLEEDIIIKTISNYNEQLELKENIRKSFPNFESLYNHFQTLDIKDKRFLLYQLPTEYHTKLLKELIKDK